MQTQFKEFLTEYENFIIPKSKGIHLKYFDATISGKPEDYQKAAELEIEINNFFADKEKFELLKNIKGSNSIDEPFEKRQLTLIYNSFAGSQFDSDLMKKIVAISNELERKFSVYRANINGKEYTDNQIDEILETSENSLELQTAWEASKQIGDEISSEVIELVKLRNQAAKELGFENYHSMSLELSEQNPKELDTFFDELDEMTRNSFQKIKNEIDDNLTKKYNVAKDELMPWHYQDKFFQQGPKITKVDFDQFYKGQDLVEITRNYYEKINLPIDDLIEKSDLFEKENKYQHAYCSDIDRNGDVRVVCNVKENYKWMGTMLHEYGHAVYDKFVNHKLPWELRTHAHIFTTEAIAMLFGRLASNTDWIKNNTNLKTEISTEIAEAGFKTLKAEQLIFSRWVQVIYRFEREMYKNPEQDLNELWWNLVEKYQEIKKPENRNLPDWAAKIHVALYPAYYHNYILGEILASQLYYYIVEKVLDNDVTKPNSFSNDKRIGDYLKNLFFGYGALLSWDELVEKATGEKLTPRYYAEQFV